MEIKNILLFIALFTLIACDKEEIETGEGTATFSKTATEIKEEILVLNSRIRLTKQGDTYTFQGDILLTPEQVEQLNQSPVTRSGYLSDWKKRWTGNIVYYSVASDFKKCSELENAITHWSERTNLIFKVRTNEKNYRHLDDTDT